MAPSRSNFNESEKWGWRVRGFAGVAVVFIITCVKTVVKMVAKTKGLHETALGLDHGLDM